MARDWNEYEAKIREEIERKVARATERANRNADRMRARAERSAERARERADWYGEKVREKAERDAERAKAGYARVSERWRMKFDGFGGGCDKGNRDLEVLIGIAILGFGAALLLSNLDFLSMRDITRFWPVLLIAAGIMRLTRAQFPSAKGFAIFLVAMGGILLLGNFGVVKVSWNLFWPAILIVIGLQHLLSNFDPPKAPKTPSTAPAGMAGSAPPPKPGPETPTSGPRASDHATSSPPPRFDGAAPPPPPDPPSGPGPSYEPDVHLHEYCIFTGGKRRISTTNFRGGEIVAVFGGVDVDLRGSQLGGDEAVVDVTAVFGGCTIRVPLNWYVEMRGVAAFGGYSNKTIPPRLGPGQRLQKLIVTGSAAFSGVLIEN